MKAVTMPAYAPHDILRRIDNGLLAEYAMRRSLFPGLDIAKLKSTDVEPIYNAIQQLEQTQREQVERDLRHVGIVADKRRIQQLFAAVQYEGHAFPEFDKKRDSHDKAMWALLEYPKIFEGVLNFSFPFTEQRHWQVFPYPAGNSAVTDANARERLSKAIGEYFRKYDGRGQHCHVDHSSFQDTEYLFAYPAPINDTEAQEAASNLLGFMELLVEIDSQHKAARNKG